MIANGAQFYQSSGIIAPMKKPIYLDYAATTPVDPRVAAKMMHYLTSDGVFGNASSTHAFGQAAKAAVDEARFQVADLIGADVTEIIWTSGATEANNLAIKGAAELYRGRGNHIITLKTEHPSVLECCQQLEKNGFSVTYLSPESNGLLDVDKLRAAIRDETILISVMHVNNEIGVIQDIKSIAELTSARGILFHVDAAQSVGKIAINCRDIPIDLLSFCAHKIYGPKGIGALYVRAKPRVRVATQIHGGGQERGMRSGTLPVHQIVGMGEALAIASVEMQKDHQHISALKTHFLQGLANFNKMQINGDMAHSAAHIANIQLGDIPAVLMIKALPDLAISVGSACHSKGNEPSYVLRALGYNAERAACGLRFSFGRFTTLDEIECAVRLILQGASNANF